MTAYDRIRQIIEDHEGHDPSYYRRPSPNAIVHVPDNLSYDVALMIQEQLQAELDKGHDIDGIKAVYGIQIKVEYLP